MLAFEAWLVWARRCRIPSFIKLAKTITANKQGIVATLTHRLSNARVEAINTTLRLICPPRLRLPLRRRPDRTRNAHRRRTTAAAFSRA